MDHNSLSTTPKSFEKLSCQMLLQLDCNRFLKMKRKPQGTSSFCYGFIFRIENEGILHHINAFYLMEDMYKNMSKQSK